MEWVASRLHLVRSTFDDVAACLTMCAQLILCQVQLCQCARIGDKLGKTFDSVAVNATAPGDLWGKEKEVRPCELRNVPLLPASSWEQPGENAHTKTLEMAGWICKAVKSASRQRVDMTQPLKFKTRRLVLVANDSAIHTRPFREKKTRIMLTDTKENSQMPKKAGRHTFITEMAA